MVIIYIANAFATELPSITQHIKGYFLIAPQNSVIMWTTILMTILTYKEIG